MALPWFSASSRLKPGTSSEVASRPPIAQLKFPARLSLLKLMLKSVLLKPFPPSRRSSLYGARKGPAARGFFRVSNGSVFPSARLRAIKITLFAALVFLTNALLSQRRAKSQRNVG